MTGPHEPPDPSTDPGAAAHSSPGPHTSPGTPGEAAAGTPASSEPSAPASPRSAGSGDQRYELGRQLRAIRLEVDGLREELGADVGRLRSEVRNRINDLRSEVTERIDGGHGEIAGELAEFLPRVADLEDQLTRLRAAFDLGGPTPGAPTAPGPDRGAGPADPTPDGDDGDDEPPVTPATGWDRMSRASAERAWAALAEFVDGVLYRQYRFTRMQIPDCWALHPRMVRELAWLRSTYLEAAELERDTPAASMPWHLRCVPGFLINAAEAVDTRECRPGIHRLTESEVSAHQYRRDAALRDGLTPPPLTTETGPDRPHLIPAHFPLRTVRSVNSTRTTDDGPTPPTPEDLPDLVVGPCHPDYWRDHYFAASAADLAERH